MNRGQILVPMILVLPMFLLFALLLFETTLVSGDKIRNQFAVDHAASTEMKNFSLFLNASAYNNGAWGTRIFHMFDRGMSERQSPPCPNDTCMEPRCDRTTDASCGPTAVRDNLYMILWKNGLFPAFITTDGSKQGSDLADSGGTDACDELPGEPDVPDTHEAPSARSRCFMQAEVWKIRFAGRQSGLPSPKTDGIDRLKVDSTDLNTLGFPGCDDPLYDRSELVSPSDLSGRDILNLISCGTAAKYRIYFGVPNPKPGRSPTTGPTNIVGGLFQSVYEKIGLVEHAQYQVFNDLSLDGTHDYYREFYRSNSGDGNPEEAEGAFPGGSAFKPEFGCVNKMIAHGYVHRDEVTQCAVSPGMVGLDPLQMYCIMRANPPVDLPQSFQGPGVNCPGLFQFAYVPPDQLAQVAVPPPPDYPRTVVQQPWETPRVRGQNAFGMDLVAEALGGKELFVRASPGLCVGPVAGFSEWCKASFEGGGKNLGGQVWPDPTPRFQVRLFP